MAPSSRISARIAAIQESATLAVDAKAKALKAAGRERHRLRCRRARLPDAGARRGGRDRGVPRPPLPPLLADAGPARAPRGDRVQDQARLRRRLRRVAGGRHQRRQARGLQHVPGAVQRGRRGARARAVLDVVSRGHHARGGVPVVLPTIGGRRFPGHDRAARSRVHAAHEGTAVRLAEQPHRRGVSARRGRGDRSLGARARASGSSPTRSTSTSLTTGTCSRRCPASSPSSWNAA